MVKPVVKRELNTVPFTDVERSAAIFIKCLADDIDQRQGRPSLRETQKKVADEVRRAFFVPDKLLGKNRPT